jgi:hypothetical protein
VSNSSDVTAQVKTELIMLDPGKILITLGGVKALRKKYPLRKILNFRGHSWRTLISKQIKCASHYFNYEPSIPAAA